MTLTLILALLTLALALTVNVIIITAKFTRVENDVKWIKKEMKDINTIFKMLSAHDTRITKIESKHKERGC